MLDSVTKCKQSPGAQYPLLAGSLEADRSFQDCDRYRTLGVMLFEDGARVQREEYNRHRGVFHEGKRRAALPPSLIRGLEFAISCSVANDTSGKSSARCSESAMTVLLVKVTYLNTSCFEARKRKLLRCLLDAHRNLHARALAAGRHKPLSYRGEASPEPVPLP